MGRRFYFCVFIRNALVRNFNEKETTMKETHNEEMGAGNSHLKSYIIGFILAVILTVVSFGLAMTESLSRHQVVTGLVIAAVLQMFVHVRYFLHMNGSSEQRWNLIALLFTALLMFIFIGGTIWVMYTLNSRMM